ncbi:MAG: succinate dehydrogenase assembly factor 2 [Candidatus Malihini olakiniferum]
MKELDISIMPFFKHEYVVLKDDEKRAFMRLLQCNDTYLFSWLMNYGESKDAELKRTISLIQTHNKDCGPVAL